MLVCWCEKCGVSNAVEEDGGSSFEDMDIIDLKQYRARRLMFACLFCCMFVGVMSICDCEYEYGRGVFRV